MIKTDQIANVLFIALLISLVLVSISSADDFPGEAQIPPPKGDQCVEDPEWMRVHHFETILHQRDETVIHGIRTTKHSLKNCIDCHITQNAKGEYARYSDSEQHFCASCHEFAAVKIDCFMCHADRPGSAVRESIMRDIKEGKDPHHSMQRNTDELILNAELLSTRE